MNSEFLFIVLGKRVRDFQSFNERIINIINKILLIAPLYLESKYMLDKNDIYLY